MTIKEYLVKNYAFMLKERPVVLVVGGESFYFDNVDKVKNNDANSYLTDHEFMFLSKAFNVKNQECYAIFGRLDI